MRKLIHVANIALIDSENKILLLKRSQRLRNPGKWGCPGGLVDPHEESQRAVIRELFEETGIEESQYIISGYKVFLAHATDEDREITLYKAQLRCPVDVRIDEHEHSDFGWFEVEALSTVENIMSDLPSMMEDLLKE